ncbi:MAG: YbjQ family protein [Candidatus Dependentiae bacterium]|nr:YbjQ family protein [Candidatus Dependentiae bacterium]
MAINTKMITTGFDLPNYRVIESLGVVRGISVRSQSIFGSFGTFFQLLRGGNIARLTSLCEKTRQEAFEILIKHAETLGANSIIGLRLDANEVLNGVTEVLAYGTAVIVEKK